MSAAVTSAELADAEFDLSQARWLVLALEMAAEHDDALTVVDDLPIKALLATVISRVVDASEKAEDVLRRAREPEREGSA